MFHELGLRLGLLKRTLDAIEMDTMGDPDESLRECLSKWLDRVDNVDIKGGATIDSLSNALRAMGETAVANKIDQKSELYLLILIANSVKPLKFNDSSFIWAKPTQMKLSPSLCMYVCTCVWA